MNRRNDTADLLIDYVAERNFDCTAADVRRDLGLSRRRYSKVKSRADQLLAARRQRLITPTFEGGYRLGITDRVEVARPGDDNQEEHYRTRLKSRLRHEETNLAIATTPDQAAMWARRAERTRMALVLSGVE